MDMQRLKRLEPPKGRIDVVLDTDAYNEIDDQFAIAYMLRAQEKLNVQALYAAPFFNQKSDGPADGMEKSYHEIIHILDLAGSAELKQSVLRGSTGYLADEATPQPSAAASDLCRRAMAYSADQPLYVVAIGAITNIASALLIRPEIAERIVIVWLGGHACWWPKNDEFNCKQDVAAVRVVFDSGAALVLLPCMGVVSEFRTTGPELEYWLRGKNALCDYLVDHTTREAEAYAKGKPWSRVIWDVAAVGWLLNEDGRLMHDHFMACPIPQYDHHYSFDPNRHLIRCVDHIERDALLADLFQKLTR